MTLLPVFARDVFHIGEAGYARMMSTSGAGAICGALLYAGLHHHFRHGLLALRVQLAFAVLLCTFSLSRNLWLSYAALFLGGVCLITLFASITSLVQLASTEEMRGRVMSIFMLAFRGGMPLGNLVTGYLAYQLSPSTALLIGSVLLGSTAVSFLASSSGIKRL
jgi:predicted MFS family arabinose efflux permease